MNRDEVNDRLRSKRITGYNSDDLMSDDEQEISEEEFNYRLDRWYREAGDNEYSQSSGT